MKIVYTFGSGGKYSESLAVGALCLGLTMAVPILCLVVAAVCTAALAVVGVFGVLGLLKRKP